MIENVIIQAGGKGERAGRYAKNKPKCLISIRGKPLLFHVCDDFPEARIQLIMSNGSKNHQVVEKFLKLHPDYAKRINILPTDFKSGDSSSLLDALNLCKGHTLICWSDILFKLPEFDYSQDTVVTTNVVKCRWKIKDGQVQQDAGDGILGCFYISDPDKSKQYFINDGCVITTLQNPDYKYTTLLIEDCKEFGMEDELVNYYWQTIPVRNYNRLTFTDTTVIKSSTDKKLIEREIGWYDVMKHLGFSNMPKKLGDNPFTLERIPGLNIYEWLSNGGTVKPSDIIAILDKLHTISVLDPNPMANEKVLIKETLKRLYLVADIHPAFQEDTIKINGKKCFNYLKNVSKLEELLRKHLLFDLQCLVTVHGDPILSNMLTDGQKLYLIDPRGYFGDVEGPFGTILYDFAKLYFSSVMNFDTFNRKLFGLTTDGDFTIDVDRRQYCMDFAYEFSQRFEEEYLFKIKLLAATMWLRFGSCVLDDYDSIVGSIVYGIEALNDLIPS